MRVGNGCSRCMMLGFVLLLVAAGPSSSPVLSQSKSVVLDVERSPIEGSLWREASAATSSSAKRPSINGLTLAALSDGMADLAARVSPALVAIDARGRLDRELPAGHPEVPLDRKIAEGSGFIIHESGIVVTNAHVIDRVAEVWIMLDSGEKRRANVLGSDRRSDLALLEILGDAGPYPILPLGRSADLRVGEILISAGNTFGLGTSFGFGMLAGERRDPPGAGAGWVGGYLQTDAMIKPGNSGGPLLNARGEVVGIASAVTGPMLTVGLAIPIDAAKSVLPFLYERGHFPQAFLGIQIIPISRPAFELARFFPDAKGDEVEAVKITGVVPDSGADRARLKEDDIIVRLGGQIVHSTVDLQESVGRLIVGDEVLVTVVRSGRIIERTVRLGEMRGETRGEMKE